jgi:hypothetical protein
LTAINSLWLHSKKNAPGVDRNRRPVPVRSGVAGGHAAGKTGKYIRINRRLLRAHRNGAHCHAGRIGDFLRLGARLAE